MSNEAWLMNARADKMLHDLDYDIRLNQYNMDTELLRIKREQFYRDNPNFPFQSMYLQVCAPPQKVNIVIEELSKPVSK
jgi:hypothetical protein